MLIALSALSVVFLLIAIHYGLKYQKARKNYFLQKEEAHIYKTQRNELVANVSHDLKTPLTAIRGLTETLITNDIPDAKMRKNIYDHIRSSTDHVLEIVQDNLDILKLETADTQLKIEKIPLSSFFSALQKKMSFLFERKNQSLKIDNKLKFLNADRALMERAFLNLLENASRYCQDGAEIKIKAFNGSSSPQWIQLQVQDNGRGIPKDEINRVFERYYRGEKSKEFAATGSGLGLSIVKHIMLSHGGQVRVESEENKGTTFSLLFPK
jgi:signal transduction histidine kinase